MTSTYWRECIEEAASECGAKLTPEQIDYIADAVEGGHENYGMAHGHDVIPNPLLGEISTLRRELATEREKVTCGVCNGRGRIVTVGPIHSSDSQCWKCRGDGKATP